MLMKRYLDCGIIAVLFANMLVLPSCGHSFSQEVSRSTQSIDIVISQDIIQSGDAISSTENDRSSELPDDPDPNSWLVRVSDPERMLSYPNKPQEYDFTISFKKDILLVDYGKKTINVYHAKYADTPEQWQEDVWQKRGVGRLIDWCEGWPVPISCEEWNGHIDAGDDYVALDKEKVLDNIYNVQVCSFSEISEASEVAETVGIDINSPVLCWVYNTCDFPWETDYVNYLRSIGGFQIPSDIESVQYIPLSTQYLDGIPIRRENKAYPVLEWSEETELSRQPEYNPLENWDGCFINSSNTAVVMFLVDKYAIGDTVSEGLSVFPADECLPGIRNAIIYNAYNHQKASADPDEFGMNYVWETDVVVYCMELAYTVLDPYPYDPFSIDEHLETHELTIVPVWIAYYTATNSKTTDGEIVYNGTVMVNAVNGESIYSEMYGPEENEYLYPHAKDPG
ncbi:MAG: hypothetical protein IK020_12240 [Clostridiales bacterium]|nr:hypothetical protein [Clostridiales bacterium]